MNRIYDRCDKECKGNDCDDYINCVAWHGSGEEHNINGFCGHASFLSSGCEICQEIYAIYSEIENGDIIERTCHECSYMFELDKINPFQDILFDKYAGVYFECQPCFTEGLEEDEEAGYIEEYNFLEDL